MGLLRTLSSALARVDERLEQAASLARHAVAALERIASAVETSNDLTALEGAAIAVGNLGYRPYIANKTPEQKAADEAVEAASRRLGQQIAVKRLSLAGYTVPPELRLA